MTTNIENKHLAAAGGGIGLLVAYLLLADSVPAALEDAQEEVQNVADRVQEVSENGELVVDPVTGVFYDDPETGELNDEPEDDWNISFDEANEVLAEAGEYIDPTTYAPDTQDGSTAPDSGVLADAGDSQEWGDAGEQENDDLTERTAESNLSDDQKSMFDRLANYDSIEEMEADNEDDTDSTSTTSTTSDSDDSTSSSTDYSWSSSSSDDSDTSTSTTSDSDDDEEDDWSDYDSTTGATFVA